MRLSCCTTSKTCDVAIDKSSSIQRRENKTNWVTLPRILVVKGGSEFLAYPLPSIRGEKSWIVWRVEEPRRTAFYQSEKCSASKISKAYWKRSKNQCNPHEQSSFPWLSPTRRYHLWQRTHTSYLRCWLVEPLLKTWHPSYLINNKNIDNSADCTHDNIAILLIPRGSLS
jgi:hypothetical protein